MCTNGVREIGWDAAAEVEQRLEHEVEQARQQGKEEGRSEVEQRYRELQYECDQRNQEIQELKIQLNGKVSLRKTSSCILVTWIFRADLENVRLDHEKLHEEMESSEQNTHKSTDPEVKPINEEKHQQRERNLEDLNEPVIVEENTE